MGNIASSNARSGRHHEHQATAEPHKADMTRRRGRAARRDRRYELQWDSPPAADATGTAYGRLSSVLYNDDNEDFCEIPASAFKAAKPRGKGPANRQPTTKAAPATNSFSFNDEAQPNPWGRRAAPEREPDRQRKPEPEHTRDFYIPQSTREQFDDIAVRQFAHTRDGDLLEYLASRDISSGFLAEIDQFLRGNPEIATCPEGRNTLTQLSSLPPLQAYRYFLKGYTRPARYVDGVVRTDDFSMPTGFPYRPLAEKHDPELLEFFDGFDYRHDVIDRIDHEVRHGMRELAEFRPISLALRKLVCYAVWGNPVDAYKWYEYSYQNEYLPHRYLPEHVVLVNIPKAKDVSVPRPHHLSGYKNHIDVRARMARANDQGVDVLHVLIAEYRFALVRRGHRRVDIDLLVSQAKKRLETEQNDPTGVDIVDLIMDDVFSRQPMRPARHYPRHAQSRAHHSFYHSGHQFQYTAPCATGASQAQAADLSQARKILMRMYDQECNAYNTSYGLNLCHSNLEAIRACRGSAERRYVHCLIGYMRDANRMTGWQTAELQKSFAHQRVGDPVMLYRNYLLGLFPPELR